MVCLPLDLISGWLFAIQPSRARQEIREQLIRYRRECLRFLWDAFKGETLPEPQEPGTHLTPAEKTLAQTKAIYNPARQQVTMERWLMHHDRRLGAAEDRLEDVEEIVGSLRLKVQGPDRLISEE